MPAPELPHRAGKKSAKATAPKPVVAPPAAPAAPAAMGALSWKPDAGATGGKAGTTGTVSTTSSTDVPPEWADDGRPADSHDDIFGGALPGVSNGDAAGAELALAGAAKPKRRFLFFKRT